MIIVSHRGPYRFVRNDDGTFTARRGAGGVVSALGPLLAEAKDAVWVAAALSTEDAQGVAESHADLDVEMVLLRLDPRLHRLHYDVVSNRVLWFLHHGLFDRSYRPQHDVHFRDAWDAYRSVNETFAQAVAERADQREIVLVQDYQLALVPAQLRTLRPDLRIVHFTHTPFCGPDDITILPNDVARELCGSLAGGPAGFHTPRWVDAYKHSARAA
ncbi:MAG TPA: trehalose-6-phosphate synthase, partial [Acidimicrobiia bacterium]|nr:trehalose-6-phosphate synthase [Acidimicrobiia bacterium]